MKTELFIQCECQGEILKVEKFDEENEYYLTVFKYYHPSLFFLRRIKYAWKVLKGEGIQTADIVLSQENFNRLKNGI